MAPLLSAAVNGSAVGDPGAWTREMEQVRLMLRSPGRILDAIADQVILPTLGRRYYASGLKERSGRLYSGITQRGAPGNYVRIEGKTVTVGVDYGAIPYAKYQLEGSMPHIIRARNKRFLSFVVNGRRIFARQVNHPGTRARLIYYLQPQDVRRAEEVATSMVRWAFLGRGQAEGAEVL